MFTKKGEDHFEEHLFKYLHDDTIPRCYLITGQWGSGKSYEVNTFFQKYYKHGKTKVYRISCFGLSSRIELIDEICNVVESKDNSIYAEIFKLIQYVPLIGDSLNKIFKKSYKISNIKKNSIFIFDDFERLSSHSLVKKHASSPNKESSIFFEPSELAEIINGINSICKSLNGLENGIDKLSIKKDYEKYISATGLINELIEVYNMKVIIICNTNVLGEKLIHDILKSKLNCLEYKKVVTNSMKISVINKIINDKILYNEKKSSIINNYLENVKKIIINKKLDDIYQDLRLFGGLIEAFIDTADLFEVDSLKEEFMSSLFNSILITHCAYYKNLSSNIKPYVPGANVEFLMKMSVSPVKKSSLIMLGKNEKLRWIDTKVSGYWILNSPTPKDIKKIEENWNKYSFFDLETELLKENKDVFKNYEDFNFVHLKYCFIYWKELDDAYKNDILKKYIKKFDLTKKEDIENVLFEISTILNFQPFEVFPSSLYDIILEHYNGEPLEQTTDLHVDFNKQLQKKRLT